MAATVREVLPLAAVTLAVLGFVAMVNAGGFTCPEDTGCTEASWHYEPPLAKAGLGLFTVGGLLAAALALRKSRRRMRIAIAVAATGLCLYAAVLWASEFDALPEPAGEPCDDDGGTGDSCKAAPGWELVYWLPVGAALVGIALVTHATFARPA